MVKLGFFSLLLVRGAWIKKPANLDLVSAAGECICKDDKVSAALQITRGICVVLRCAFCVFKAFFILNGYC